MNSDEIAGIAFFVLLLVGAYAGLRVLSRKRVRTEAEFERGAAESSSLVGAGVKALQGILDPGHERAKRAVAEFESGVYDKKGESGEGPKAGVLMGSAEKKKKV